MSLGVKMQELREALNKVEWPTGTEVSGKFVLVMIVIIALIAIIAMSDGLLGYLLGFIY